MCSSDLTAPTPWASPSHSARTARPSAATKRGTGPADAGRRLGADRRFVVEVERGDAERVLVDRAEERDRAGEDVREAMLWTVAGKPHESR